MRGRREINAIYGNGTNSDSFIGLKNNKRVNKPKYIHGEKLKSANLDPLSLKKTQNK